MLLEMNSHRRKIPPRSPKSRSKSERYHYTAYYAQSLPSCGLLPTTVPYLSALTYRPLPLAQFSSLYHIPSFFRYFQGFPELLQVTAYFPLARRKQEGCHRSVGDAGNNRNQQSLWKPDVGFSISNDVLHYLCGLLPNCYPLPERPYFSLGFHTRILPRIFQASRPNLWFTPELLCITDGGRNQDFFENNGE